MPGSGDRPTIEVSERRNRVLFVTNHYPTATKPGDSPAIARQRGALEALGYRVDVLHFDSTRSRLAYLTALPRLVAKAHLGRRYDVVHAHYGHLCGWVARFQLRSPVLVTFRGSDVLDQREWPFSRALAGRIQGAVVMTDEMRDRLGRADAEVVPYGIDISVFRPTGRAEARAELGLPAGAPLVLFPYDPARPEKRFDLVEQAMARVRERQPEARLLVVHGQTPQVVATYMNACDVMVLASDREGSPVAVREALACGLPVVSVDVGDVATVLDPRGDDDGAAGRPPGVIVPRDPVAMGDAILGIASAPYRSVAPPGSVVGIEASAEAVSAIYTRISSR